MYSFRLILLIGVFCNHFAVTGQSDTSVFAPSGKMIFQVFDRTIVNATSGTYGMFINRAFFGYSYRFDPKWSGTLVIDAGNPTLFGNLEVKDTNGTQLETSYLYNEGSVYTSFLKFAFIEYQPTPALKIQAGGILQNHYITQEKFWGYRFTLQTFQDLYFKIPSSDLGIIVFFEPNKMISADAAITNGDGIRFNRSSWGYPKFAGGVTLKPFTGLTLRAFYDHYKGNDHSGTAPQQLFSFFSGYRFGEKGRIGAEFNYHKNHDHADGHDLYGPSIYGSFSMFKKLELFARFDLLRSNTTEGEENPWNYQRDGQLFMGGLSYYPVKGIAFSLSYQGWNPANHSTFTNNVALCFEFKL